MALSAKLWATMAAWWILGMATEAWAASAVEVGVGVGQRRFETMSIGDARPVGKGEVGCAAEVRYRVTGRVTVVGGGWVGGSWFEFNSSTVGGNVKDLSWNTRWGVEVAEEEGTRWLIALGVGFEYGEARSWLKNTTMSEEGPRVFMPGGDIRVRAGYRLGRRLAVEAIVKEAVYRAHTRWGDIKGAYNWLGSAMSTSIGLSYQLWGEYR